MDFIKVRIEQELRKLLVKEQQDVKRNKNG